MSGFVLSHTLICQRSSWRHYFYKRFARLWPLHVASALLVLAVLLNNAIHNQFVPAWWHRNFASILVSNALMLQNMDIMKGLANQTINDPSWSISVEFWVSGVILYPLTKQKWYVSLVIAVVAYGSLSFHSTEPFQAVGGIGLRLSGGCFRGLGGIALGHCVFKLVLYLQKRHVELTGHIISYGKYMLLLPLACAIYTGDPRYSWGGFILFVLFVFVASLETKRDHIFASRVFVWLGKVSFSLYLIHTVVILSIEPLSYARIWGDFWTAAYAMALCLVLSVLIHYAFEEPSRLYLYGFTSRVTKQRYSTVSMLG